MFRSFGLYNHARLRIRMTEMEMAEGCKRHDPKVQKKVFEHYYGIMLGICLRYAQGREEARDMLQDGFVKIFEKIDQYHPDYSFVGWMKRVMVNNAIDQYRRDMRMPTSDDESVLSNQSVDNDVFKDLAYEEIIQMIQRLPKGYRTVFNMYVIEGYTHKEIGELLGIAEGTSKSQLNKAKLLLKRQIEQLNFYK
ncbi:MAG: sigma-70 family RNA polymerase sigma factor [Bacteroidetes bacterium]|nr:sigma-70 family RNA polymerase sigma factor [Bacteroidota bacterium]